MKKYLLIGIVILFLSGIWLFATLILKREHSPDLGYVLFKDGDVQITRLGMVSSPRVGEKILSDDRIQTLDGTVDIGLTGEFVVVLRLKPNSIFSMRELEDYSRNLHLEAGRILLKVQKLDGSDPIQITTPTTVIYIRGTAFEIQVMLQKTSILVTEGIIESRNRVDASRARVLYAGDWMQFGRTRSEDRYRRDEARARANEREFRQMMELFETETMIYPSPENFRRMFEEQKKRDEALFKKLEPQEIITLKSGERIAGRLIDQKDGYLIIETRNGQRKVAISDVESSVIE